MRISGICQNFNYVQRPSFKANVPFEDDVLPDSIFALKNNRDFEYTLDATPNYYSLIEPVGKPVSGDLKNLKINSFRDLGNGNYKGGMESAKYYVPQLKELGIRKFIILCNPEESNVGEFCRRADMDTIRLYVPLKTFLTEADKDIVVNKLSRLSYISAMEELRKGNVFIGCESGNLRTCRALSTLKILDPNSPLPSNVLNNNPDKEFTNWLYELFTPEQKAILKYTENFEESLKSFLKIL